MLVYKIIMTRSINEIVTIWRTIARDPSNDPSLDEFPGSKRFLRETQLKSTRHNADFSALDLARSTSDTPLLLLPLPHAFTLRGKCQRTVLNKYKKVTDWQWATYVPRERRGEKARRYGGVLICRRRASRRHCRAKSIGLRLRNDSRNTGSDSGIPVATVFQADKFSTGHTIDRRKRKRCPFDSFSFHGGYTNIICSYEQEFRFKSFQQRNSRYFSIIGK